MICEHCHAPIDDDPHAFSGWGFFVRYHAACCPREMDGWACPYPHPEPQPAVPLAGVPLAGLPLSGVPLSGVPAGPAAETS